MQIAHGVGRRQGGDRRAVIIRILLERRGVDLRAKLSDLTVEEVEEISGSLPYGPPYEREHSE